jgi:hypothetical protein
MVGSDQIPAPADSGFAVALSSNQNKLEGAMPPFSQNASIAKKSDLFS